MRPSETLALHRQEIRKIFAQYPQLINLRVFGSVARGEDSPESDIDFLVTPLPKASLLDIGGLYSDLREIFGDRVDIISERTLRDADREAILSEAIAV